MAGISDDDGAVGEGVGTNGGNDVGFDGGMNDGTAGGKGVGGGASGSGENESIGTIAADEVIVNKQLEFNHTSESAFVDNGVVEDVLKIDEGLGAQEFHLQHDAFAHGGASG